MGGAEKEPGATGGGVWGGSSSLSRAKTSKFSCCSFGEWEY